VKNRIFGVKLRPALLCCCVALSIAACGSDPAGPSVELSTPVGGETGTELAAEQVIRIGNGAEPQTLDPHRAQGVPASNVLRNIFEGLTSEAPNGDVVPGVAERWNVSPDGTVYTFELRRNAHWNNGDPVTSADFVFGLRRSVDPKTLSYYSSILEPILNAAEVIRGELPPEDLGVEAIDDFTLVIRLTGPTPYLPGLLNHNVAFPVHRASVEKHRDRFARAGNLVSNGAYYLADWVVQSHIKVVRNSHYWDNENTTVDTVWFYSIENTDAELKRYRAGEFDVTENVPYKQLKWIRENLGDELVIAPYLGAYYYGYNVTRPPFKDNLQLRQAMALAIDRDILTQRITGAGEIPAYGWVPPVNNYTGQTYEWSAWTQAERNAEAQRLYSEAGYSRENPLKVELLYNTDENHKRVSVAIASMWKKVLGVETGLANQEWKVFLETRRRREETEVFRGGWIGDFNDAYTFSQLMASNNGLNYSGYNNPAYDALLQKAAAEPDSQQRARLMEESERLLLEAQPIIPLYYYVSKHLVKPWVAGREPNIMDHHYVKNFRIFSH
jgi:oligopeptide transport system substrate-binding protein